MFIQANRCVLRLLALLHLLFQEFLQIFYFTHVQPFFGCKLKLSFLILCQFDFALLGKELSVEVIRVLEALGKLVYVDGGFSRVYLRLGFFEQLVIRCVSFSLVCCLGHVEVEARLGKLAVLLWVVVGPYRHVKELTCCVISED